MKKEHDIFEPLYGIERVEAPDYLLTRIQGRLVKSTTSNHFQLYWAYAAILAIFIGIGLRAENDETKEEQQSYINYLGHETTSYLEYYE